MSLVDYDSSPESSPPSSPKIAQSDGVVGSQRHRQSGSKRPPPPPSSFMSQFVASRRVGDDAELHGGRMRTQAHTVGQWPTHVYFDWWPGDEQLVQLEAVVQIAIKGGSAVTPLFRSGLGVRQPLHVSLSPNVMLETAQREEARSLFESRLGRSGPFELSLAGTAVFLDNEDGTRRFLTLPLAQGKAKVIAMIKEVNAILCQLGQTGLAVYDTPHISIGWMLPKDSSQSNTSPLDLGLDVSRALQAVRIRPSALCIRIGQKVSEIPLSPFESDFFFFPGGSTPRPP